MCNFRGQLFHITILNPESMFVYNAKTVTTLTPYQIITQTTQTCRDVEERKRGRKRQRIAKEGKRKTRKEKNMERVREK